MIEEAWDNAAGKLSGKKSAIILWEIFVFVEQALVVDRLECIRKDKGLFSYS